MFAYCLNNPVNYSDHGGNSPEYIHKLEERADKILDAILNCPFPTYNIKDRYEVLYEIEQLKTQKAHPVGGTGIGNTYPGHQPTARDFDAMAGSPIYASMGGIVTNVVMSYSNDYYSGSTKKDNEYGNFIEITVWDGTKIIYAHQQKSNYIEVGDLVYAGQQIGLVGHTGYCDPQNHNHVHFQTSGGNVDDYYLH